MTVQDFLRETYKLDDFGQLLRRPHIVCKDGFTMSVQASYCSHCYPQANLDNGEYTSVEVGAVSEHHEALHRYVEVADDEFPIYQFVPIKVIELIIEQHEGLDNDFMNKVMQYSQCSN